MCAAQKGFHTSVCVGVGACLTQIVQSSNAWESEKAALPAAVIGLHEYIAHANGPALAPLVHPRLVRQQSLYALRPGYAHARQWDARWVGGRADVSRYSVLGPRLA